MNIDMAAMHAIEAERGIPAGELLDTIKTATTSRDASTGTWYHGMISTPSTAVIIPPVRNEIRRGDRLEKSLAGLTTFAAIFVESVATDKATSEKATTGNEPIFATSFTGSQIASP